MDRPIVTLGEVRAMAEMMRSEGITHLEVNGVVIDIHSAFLRVPSDNASLVTQSALDVPDSRAEEERLKDEYEEALFHSSG